MKQESLEKFMEIEENTRGFTNCQKAEDAAQKLSQRLQVCF
jgi:hypothetical protein